MRKLRIISNVSIENDTITLRKSVHGSKDGKPCVNLWDCPAACTCNADLSLGLDTALLWELCASLDEELDEDHIKYYNEDVDDYKSFLNKNDSKNIEKTFQNGGAYQVWERLYEIHFELVDALEYFQEESSKWNFAYTIMNYHKGNYPKEHKVIDKWQSRHMKALWAVKDAVNEITPLLMKWEIKKDKEAINGK